MRASYCDKYGNPDAILIKELQKPVPKNNEILIKVQAATVNRTDCGILNGTPWIIRFFTGLTKPKIKTTGTDFAGDIEATGDNVKAFKVGDRVMGLGAMGLGSHAEFIALPESYPIISIPGKLSYEEAAACLEGAFYAYETIRNLKPEAGQTALVNGATGAISSAAIQVLKYLDIKVTAVCAGEDSEIARSLGADRVIDYKTEDFTKDKEQYDFVIDAVGKSSFFKCKRLLKKKGTYTTTDGLWNFVLAIFTPLFGGRKVVFKPPQNIKAGLLYIKAMIEKNKFIPLIDRKYPLEKIVEAFKYVETGQKKGNVIITMN